MAQILELIEGEPLSLIVALALFAYVGNWSVGGHQKLRTWGWRLALVAFVAYVAYAVTRDGVSNGQYLASAAFRGILAGGLALGTSWILLALFAFTIGNLWQSVPKPTRRSSVSREELQRREAEHSQAREEERRNAAERESRERERQRHQLAKLETEKADKKRREDARLRCQMLYDRHQAALAPHFSRERLLEYFQTFLTDTHPPDQVEERARLLEQLLHQALEVASQNGHKFRSLGDIADYFRDRREDLVRAGYPEDVWDSLNTDIAEQEQAAIREFLKP